MNERRLFHYLMCLFVLVGCGDSTPVTSECGDPIPEEELEDCFIETDGDFVNREDLDVLCETRCTRIEGSVSIAGLEGVRDLRAFRNVREVRSMRIENTWDLETLDGIEGVQWRDPSFGVVIDGNDSLRSIEALNAPSRGNLQIWNNPKLESLKGLENAVEPERVRIDNNDSLRNLQGLNNLERADLLSFMGNERLESGEGLDSVTTVTGSFNFIDNPNLADVSTTLPSAESIQQVSIRGNSSLRQCDLDSFVERVAPIETRIGSNGPACQ